MKLSQLYIILALLSIHLLFLQSSAQAESLKPFVLGSARSGNIETVVASVQSSLTDQGFTIVGTYKPFESATVICVTSTELLSAAAQADNGGFGAAQRIAVTNVDDTLQISYVNPLYLGTAYGLGKLEKVSEALVKALGHETEFGSEKGVKEKKLVPGKYHYKMLMPYFGDVDILNTFDDYQSGTAMVEKNLAEGIGGTSKVYRIDLPGKEISVFGVAIPLGDGPDSGAKDTDKEILDIIDYRDYRSTAYLPYEIMVQGNQAIALRGRYRIAVHFPDTKMVGEHGFTAIMSAPGGIKKALKAVSGN